MPVLEKPTQSNGGQAPVEETARRIFGDDRQARQRWVRYWSESIERNRDLLNSFRPIVLLDFTGKTVLDIGCGAGGLGDLTSERCRLYVGADPESKVLRLARPAPRRGYLQCTGIRLPFPSAAFDYVFAFDVIEHLVGGWIWQEDFLRELRRVIRPTGMIFLTTPNKWYPYDAHTQLFFPQYLPTALSDRYIAWRNPAFLKEHRSFSEIKLVSPRLLRRGLRRSGLAFLHELPCALDRREYLRLHPLRGLLGYLGLGWHTHAEFWGILVRQEMVGKLQLKLRDRWVYEKNQPSTIPLGEFSACIDFRNGPHNHQLGPGWHWYESDDRPFRWTSAESICYLETSSPAPYLAINGYSSAPNRLQVWVEGVRVGECALRSESEFRLRYLLPCAAADSICEVRICCDSAATPGQGDDRRLGVMIFSVALQTTFEG